MDGMPKLATAAAAADAGEAPAAGGGAPWFGAAASTDGADPAAVRWCDLGSVVIWGCCSGGGALGVVVGDLS